MKQKKTIFLGLIAISAFLLMGVSCSGGNTTDSTTTTDNNDISLDNQDPALLGDWQLISQNVAGSELRLDTGRILTFQDNNTYHEDFNVETLEKVATEQCKSSGTNKGKYYVTIDSIADDGGQESPAMIVELDRSPEADEITSICEDGPGGQVVTSTGTSTPLGVGMGSTSCEGDFSTGDCVRYEYLITGDEELILSTIEGPEATFTFKRKQ